MIEALTSTFKPFKGSQRHIYDQNISFKMIFAIIALIGAIEPLRALMRTTMNTPLPIPVDRTLKKLGADLSLARRRRQISQASLAERIGASTMTVRRMEKGNPLIPLQYLARALHVFGELARLNGLLDSAVDDIGLSLMNEKVPTRVRGPAKSDKPSASGKSTRHSGAL